MISVLLADSYRPSSLFVSYCDVFYFCRGVSCLRCSFLALLCFQVILRFALRPFLSIERDYICPSLSFYLYALVYSHPPSLIQSSYLSSAHNHTSIRRSSLFFRFSPQSLLASRNRQTFQRFALHCTPVRHRVIVKRLYSPD